MNMELLVRASAEIEDFTDKLGENFFDAIMEDDNTTREMAKRIINTFCECKTKRDFEIANNMLMATCGYYFEFLVDRIKELDEDGHVWESC